MRKRTQGGYTKSNWGRRRVKPLHSKNRKTQFTVKRSFKRYKNYSK